MALGTNFERKQTMYFRSTSARILSSNSSPNSSPPQNQERSSIVRQSQKWRLSESDSLLEPLLSICGYKANQSMFVILGALCLIWCVGFSMTVLSSRDNLSLWFLQGTASTGSLIMPKARRPRVPGPPLLRGTGVYSIPLPLPKEKVSVVLMNYGRPRMIRESAMMRTLLEHPNVDEVLLLHSIYNTAFEFVHPKVVNVDAMDQNDSMGLSLRFYFCQVAKNPWVMHLDDDMEFSAEALNELFIEFGRNTKRIVGRFGRDLTPGNSFNGYNSKSRHKSAEVVLTKFMIMERNVCSAFFEYSHLVWNDIVLRDGEGPLWNGEDIFMSLVANHVYDMPSDGRSFNNYAMDWLDVWQADDSLKDYDNGKLDISGGMKGYYIWDWRWWQTVLRRNRHYSYRGRLWQAARERLKGLGRL